MDNKKVVLNVGGVQHMTYLSTLQRGPSSRLALITEDDPAYDPHNKEYFYDHNPHLFVYILAYYRTGRLHFPHEVCGLALREELEFWGISDSAIADCCWATYQQQKQEEHKLQQLRQVFCAQQVQQQVHKGWKNCVWLFLEVPQSSTGAKIWAYLFMLLVLASIAVVCAETHPMFRVFPSPPQPTLTHVNGTKMRLFLTTRAHPALVSVDYVCTGVFTLELLLKFIVWPGKLSFFTTFFNVIDLLSVIPMLINNILRLVHPFFWRDNNLFFGYCVISVSNVFRAVRILKLVKHHRGLQIMYLAMRASASEILLLLLLIIIGTIIFSTMIFFAEFPQEDTFPHIPIGFWWAIVTMTTVGYGDVTPTSCLGYIVGSVCAITGMLATGLPIPVIANNFYLYHSYAQRCDRMNHEEDLKRKDEGGGAQWSRERWEGDEGTNQGQRRYSQDEGVYDEKGRREHWEREEPNRGKSLCSNNRIKLSREQWKGEATNCAQRRYDTDEGVHYGNGKRETKLHNGETLLLPDSNGSVSLHSSSAMEDTL